MLHKFKKYLHFIKRWHLALAVISFSLFLAAVGYVRLLNHHPDFIHFWRQTDTISIVKNYHHGGMNFFEPQTHHLNANQGTSGHAVSEMPYLYYLVAGLQHIFGDEIWVFRLLWTLILISGFASFYLLAIEWLKSKFISFLLAMIVFSSPLLVFYGNSFIPDVPAFCFSIIGWMFFSRWLKEKNERLLWLTAIFFAMAGLLKATAMVSFFALAGVWGLELMGLRIGDGGKKVFPKPWKQAIPFILAFAVFAIWNIWALYYNRSNDSVFFSMRTWPIWNPNIVGTDLIASTFRNIKNHHIPMVFGPSTWIMVGFSLAVLVAFFFKVNKLLITIVGFLLIGVSSMVLLWFTALHGHDYYFIIMTLLPVFVLLAGLHLILTQRHNKNLVKYLTIGLLIAVLSFSIPHALSKQGKRMLTRTELYAQVAPLIPFLIELGIEPNDRVISLPDPTPNYTLATLNRKGWTDYWFWTSNNDSIISRINSGAKYLILGNYEHTLETKQYLKEYAKEPMGKLGKTAVFRIDGKPATRFLHQEVDTIFYVKSDAEIMVNTFDNVFATTQESVSSSGNAKPTKTFSYSGQQSVLANLKDQYALSTNVERKDAEFALVRIKRKGQGGLLVLATSGKAPIYITQSKGTPIKDTSWESLEITLRLEGKGTAETLSAYGWNNSGEDVFFDDLEIVFYNIRGRVIDKATNE